MSEVKTLAMLVLGGAFDATELGDNEIYPDMSLIEALQQELVTGFDDVSIELVSRIAYDAAQSELAALREELASTKTSLEAVTLNLSRVDDCLFKKSLRLTAAEQRNAACKEEIVTMVESALRRSFSLGQIYWQQADSDSTCQQNKSDQTMEVQTQHVLNVVKSINALTKPSESGASE